ncbi:MAG: YggS family pyridoxal phosphate enzyme [Nitrospinae bacterium]|nr:YggS family pyridoxal phosphate enzyme [Nitrospinota bacterium]
MKKNLDVVRANVEKAAFRSGRRLSDITIVAVTKTVGVPEIRTAIEHGVKIIGESRVQEAVKKHEEIGDLVEWHFIGPLQKNKAKFIPRLFSLVHSVDSHEIAAELGRRAGGRVVPVLLEINIAGENSKHGVESLSLLGLENATFDILSFGMTDDYVVAVEEGATHLRIGRGIFGER